MNIVAIIGVSIPLFLFFFIYKVVDSCVKSKNKNRLIDKLDKLDLSEAEKLNITQILENKSDKKHNITTALRTGLILTGVGLGVLIAWIIDLNIVDVQNIEIIYGALALLFGGLAFIISFLIEKTMQNKEIK